MKMVLKRGKNGEFVESCRPISLLPALCKILEINFLNSLAPIVESRKIIPNHQFVFRKSHGTIEQVYRLVEIIHSAFEKRNIAQQHSWSFLKHSIGSGMTAWYINRRNFFQPISICYSNLISLIFYINQDESATTLLQINAGVPQGSVLGPILYLLFTYDLPVSNNVAIDTFADDTAILQVTQY